MFVGAALSKLLVDFLPLKYTPPVQMPSFTPDISYTAVFIHGITLVLLFPIAEEIFFRSYLLEQLRKIMHSGVALLIQSLLFALAHLPRTQFYFHAGGYQVVIATFFYGLILGAWRIRFRSIIPLMLAHVLLNGVVSISSLKTQYDFAQFSTDMPSDFFARTRTSPQCWKIYKLTKEPISKAIPAIIEFVGDQDEVVSVYAAGVLQNHYRNDAEPYLKEALASDNKKTVESALFLIGPWHWSNLQEEVRTVAWTHNDPHIQRRAALILLDLKDAVGLRKIAEEHPKENIRNAAKEYLRRLEEDK
ncbi:MAG: CPBP family intramembrane metalloprotease [Planctomycetes bacterium]|nr:CPBP family intramembrane metalloprotease [Planctomycetota bacterium]MBU4397752.1 CPBP family intramembrane metalloprotease [Planctomycetota bacterium]MCG2684233.1 CPBP family glutamic-type intramembrane protease [Planctomycetales bacterium]